MENKYKNPVVILGTGRSGTSLTAGILYELDLYLGDEFIPADMNNATGHWEDLEFTTLNRKMVMGQMLLEDWEDGIKKLIWKRQAKAKRLDKRWGWKIPVTANLLPEYKKVFKELEIEPNWVVCERDRESVIESCLRCYGGERKQWEDLADSRIEMIDKHLKQAGDQSFKVVNLKELIENPKRVALELSAWLELPIISHEHQGVTLYPQIDKATRIVNNQYKEAKVMIAIPNMGSIHSELALRLINWSTRGNVAVYAPTNLAPVDHARNQCVKTFLESDFTHLWFIDADTVPPDHALKSLLQANEPVVSGITPTFKVDPATGSPKKTPMVFAFGESVDFQMEDTARDKETLPSERPLHSVSGEGIQKIDASGASCLMIKREVLEKLQIPAFKIRYNEKGIAIQGEDLYFSSSLRDAGIPMYANFHVNCFHRKEITL